MTSSLVYVYGEGEKSRAQQADMICPACSCPPVVPFAHTACGIMACKECFFSSKECMHCHAAVVTADLVPVTLRHILLFLQGLKVNCPGCSCSVTRGIYAEHVQECPIPCPRGCGEKIRPLTSAAHDSVCGRVETPCTAFGCTVRLPRQSLPQHVTACPFVTLEPAFRLLLATMDERHRQIVMAMDEKLTQMRVDVEEERENDKEGKMRIVPRYDPAASSLLATAIKDPRGKKKILTQGTADS